MAQYAPDFDTEPGEGTTITSPHPTAQPPVSGPWPPRPGTSGLRQPSNMTGDSVDFSDARLAAVWEALGCQNAAHDAFRDETRWEFASLRTSLSGAILDVQNVARERDALRLETEEKGAEIERLRLQVRALEARVVHAVSASPAFDQTTDSLAGPPPPAHAEPSMEAQYDPEAIDTMEAVEVSPAECTSREEKCPLPHSPATSSADGDEAPTIVPDLPHPDQDKSSTLSASQRGSARPAIGSKVGDHPMPSQGASVSRQRSPSHETHEVDAVDGADGVVSFGVGALSAYSSSSESSHTTPCDEPQDVVDAVRDEDDGSPGTIADEPGKEHRSHDNSQEGGTGTTVDEAGGEHRARRESLEEGELIQG